MASGISDFGAEAWISTLFGILPVPSGYYIALVNDEPGPAMDGDILADLEPDAPDYRRRRYGIGGGYWAAGDSFVTSVQDLNWGAAVADWGDVNHYVLCTQPTGGEIYAWGELLNPVYVQSGFFVSLPAGGMVIALGALTAQIVA